MPMKDFSKIISELQAGNEELELARAKADALFLGIGEGAIFTDEKGMISRVNQAAFDMLGYTQEELLGKWYPKTIEVYDEKGELIRIIDRPITKAFLTGKAVTMQVFIKLKNGKLLPASVTSSPVIMDGKPIGAIQIFRDFTKEYEIDKMKSEFISIASHQLRTPLTSIMTNAHLLADGYVGRLTDEQQIFMNNITFSVDRMHELISTLLNITRIEAGKVAINPKETDLKRIVQEINNELQPQIEAKKLTLTSALNYDEPVMTDPVLIREVFANLLSNAIKYTPQGGKIRVTLKKDKEEIVYRVKDNGYGIPEEQQDHIFTKFFRAENIVQTESVGTGLGLYMVQGIVENIGGRIWFESKEGMGSTFYFALPNTELRGKAGSTTIETTIRS